jgi:hypothetical protein
MTKREYHSYINKLFYEYIEEVFPHYIIDPSEGHGSVYLIDPRDNLGSIQYSQSKHTLDTYTWNKPYVKNNIERMEKYLSKVIIPKANMVKMALDKQKHNSLSLK